MPVSSNLKEKITKPRWSKYLMPLCLLVLTAVAGYYYWQYTRTIQEQKSNEVAHTVNLVGSLIELPVGEAPTLATVKDKKKLADQPFFKQAENGDKVLMYLQAKKAILYRPKTHKIIDVVAINTVTTTPTPSTAAKTSPTPTVKSELKAVLINGTSTVGLTGDFEKILLEDTDGLQVIDKSNASSSTIEKSSIVYTRPSAKKSAEDLAKTYGMEVTDSTKETYPADADLVIILGSDYSKISQ